MSSYITKSELQVEKPDYQCVSLFLIDRLKNYDENVILLNMDSDRRWTGEQVYESCLNLSYHLITEYLLKPGDIVCFIVPNSDLLAIAILGVMAAGGVNCSISPLSSTREISEIVKNIKPSFIVCNAENYGIASTLFSELPFIRNLLLIDEKSRKSLDINISTETIEIILRYERSFLKLPIETSLDDNVMLIMSSGSTGLPKAIKRTNRNLIAVANALQHPELAMHRPGDIDMLPFFGHISGIRGLFQTISGGATAAISSNEEWKEDLYMNIEKYKITNIFLVPSQLYFMIKNYHIVSKYDISSLQDVMIGGASLPVAIHNETENKFKFKKFRLVYGMSEIGWGLQVYLSDSKRLQDFSTAGKPVPGTEIKIIDESGKSLPYDSTGEICIRGDQVTNGYLNNEIENRKSFTSDGFFRSGDSGYYDRNGFFYLNGRIKDIIIVEGINVSPFELEAIIMSHNSVEEVAVIGIEVDEGTNEMPKAYVVLKHGFHLTEAELIEFVDLRVCREKRLRGGVKFLKQFPRTSLGKIKRSELKNL